MWRFFFASPASGLARFLTEAIKTELKVPVLWGGRDSTFNPAENIQHTDAVCIGEAEYPIRFFVEAMNNGGETDNVPSIWMNDCGIIHRNPMIHLETNLDCLPFPDFKPANQTVIAEGAIDPAPYPPRSSLHTNLIVMASRECPFTCPYCGSAHDGLEHGESPSTRIRSVDSVIEELRLRLRESPQPIERIEFHDVVFPFDREWVEAFAGRYTTEIARPFYGYTRPGAGCPEVFQTLKAAGLQSLIMRVPTGSRRVLEKLYGHSFSKDSVIETAFQIENAGIQPLFEYIVNNPWETEEDHLETLDLICDLPPCGAIVKNRPLAFYSNCRLYETAREDGLLDEFERRSGEGAYQAKEKPIHLFWECLYILGHCKRFNKESLMEMASDEYLKENPGILKEMAVNLYNALYLDGNPMADKDRFVQQIRWRIAEVENLSDKPIVRNVKRLAQTLRSW